MTYIVTLNSICKRTPSDHFWVELLEKLNKAQMNDIKINIEFILDFLGFDDALWALRALPEEQDNAVRLLICDLVEPALRFTNDLRLTKALQIARIYAKGRVTKKALTAAKDVAEAAAKTAMHNKNNNSEAAKYFAENTAQIANAVALAANDVARDSALDAAQLAAEAAWTITCAAVEAVTRDAGDISFAAAKAAKAVAVAEQERIFRKWLMENES